MDEVKNTEIVDQTPVAESVSEHIKLEFRNQFLVKPLDPVMVEKEFDTPVPAKDEPTTDENGIEATDYAEVTKEIKTVESDYRKAIVLKIPYEYTRQMNDEKFPAQPINVGDVIIYRATTGRWFDQLKDSQIVSTYDILAVEK